MAIKVVDIADEIHRELGSPPDRDWETEKILKYFNPNVGLRGHMGHLGL